MIPYRDTIPVNHTPWMTWALIALNGLVFVCTSLMPGPELRALQYEYGLVSARFTLYDWGLGDVWPFVSCLFIHGSALHWVLNMWMLWIFGDNIEDRMGPLRFLLFYVLCGIVAGMSHVYANPQSILPAVGASGAIAGVLGAYYFLFPYARIVIWMFFLPLFIEVPAIAFLGFWVIVQLYKVTTGAGGATADIAWFGHLGGFIAGMLLHRFFLLRARNQTGALLGS